MCVGNFIAVSAYVDYLRANQEVKASARVVGLLDTLGVVEYQTDAYDKLMEAAADQLGEQWADALRVNLSARAAELGVSFEVYDRYNADYADVSGKGADWQKEIRRLKLLSDERLVEVTFQLENTAGSLLQFPPSGNDADEVNIWAAGELYDRLQRLALTKTREQALEEFKAQENAARDERKDAADLVVKLGLGVLGGVATVLLVAREWDFWG